MKYVGSRVRAIDWQERTSGTTRYTADLRFDGLLMGRILRSPYPFARILGIDVSEAVRMPGVHAVVTSSDFPAGARYMHEGARDRPPLADGVVRFVGQEVAAVAAETGEQADAALAAINVRYAPKEAPLTIDEALRSNATELHPRSSGIKNVSARIVRSWGDARGGIDASTVLIEGRFSFPRQAHACMEPNTTIASWDENRRRLELWTSTHAAHFVVVELANLLKLEPSQIVCHEVAVGGGFGSKSRISEHEAIAALLSQVSKRPVLIVQTRDDEFATTKSRHAFDVWLQLHADKKGKLRALRTKVLAENGAYDHSGVSVVAASIKAFGIGCYQPDGIEAEGLLVDTAKLPGGQFRGYGTTQTNFALECLLDELAERYGCDPIEFRLKNLNKFPATTLAGAEVGSSRIAECLQAVREAINWDAERAARKWGRGTGVAIGVHSSGFFAMPGANRSDAAIDVFATGRIRLRFGGTDAGTGQKTILAQIAADELGVDIAQIDVVSTESDATPFDMGAWSSRGTHYSGHAVKKAAAEAAKQLRDLAVHRLGDGEIRLERGLAICGSRSVLLGELVGLSNQAMDGVLTIESSYLEEGVTLPTASGTGNNSPSYNYAAHAALVSVDVRTGKLRILDYVAAHDVGRPINPQFVEGQISGGAVMGIGAAIGEELIFQSGRLANPSYLYYSLPRAADLPPIRTIIVDGADPRGPYGAKAVGEMSIHPPAPALANAVYDAIGIRIRALPITPDKILNALAEKRGEKRRRNIWRRPSRWWVALVRWAYPYGLFHLLHRRSVRAEKKRSAKRPPVLQRPTTLKNAIECLRNGGIAIAGGTDVQPQMRQGLVAAEQLVSLLRIPELTTISESENGVLTIGSAVSLDRLATTLRRYNPSLADLVEEIATPQIRSLATLGGNLLQSKRCWFYRANFPCYKRHGGLSPCYAITGDHRFHHNAINGHRCQAVTPSDLASAFVAMDGLALIIGSEGERQLPMTSLYSGPGESVLADNEILAEIRISIPSTQRKIAYEKLRLWQGDFSIVLCVIAADIDPEGSWRNLRIVLGGLASTPWRARQTEARLEGMMVSSALLGEELRRELSNIAHPLPHNAWKLDAAVGLAENVTDRLLAASTPNSDDN